jgi:hypothetical protein
LRSGAGNIEGENEDTHVPDVFPAVVHREVPTQATRTIRN